ncbi:MAG: DeoR/GlpR family DNA-binding transcription regulator [Clostridiaceae bacterium]
MFGIERRSKMMSMLYDKKSILVQEAAVVFGVTEETIRRDLKELEQQGLLSRTYGGAVLADDTRTEAPLNIREGINIEGKDSIGRYAAGLVNDGDTILLDASTSSLYVAKHIKDKKGLTVITNAEPIIFELSGSDDITLICTGGILRNKSLSYVGRAAENAINNYYANKLFFSCKGFSPIRDLTDSNEQESEIRKTMLRCSNQAIFLCDHTKFDKVGYVNTARLADVDMIITDVPLPDSWSDYIKGSSAHVEIAK